MIVKKSLLVIFVIFAFSKLSAQLCQGSLGDPIVNITFGAGSNPGPPLTTTRNLSFYYNDCPQDGFYTIRSNTTSCHRNTWHTLTADHTGDPSGYFMLVNASLQKSEFYIDTLSGLCPNTTYEFAAWILNVIVPTACMGNPKTPNLTFSIEKTDGTVLQTYTTGDIASTQSPVWNQYGSFFTTPANVTNVVLRLINNSSGGCGNDLAIDDITFRPCGPLLVPSIKDQSGSLKVLCQGDSADVELQCKVSAGYNNPSFQWQESKDGGNSWKSIPGETKTSLIRKFTSTSPVGQYLYRLNVGEAVNNNLALCRVVSTNLTVQVNSNPVTSIFSNSPACQGNTLSLSATGGTQGGQYVWWGSNSFAATGSAAVIKDAQLVNAGRYYLKVTNPDGCKHTDSINVSIVPSPQVALAFSDKSICKGDSVLLSSSGGTNYVWSPASSLSSATIPNPVAKPSDSTTYKVVVSNNSCQDSSTVTINVLPKPVANAGSDKVIIEGQTVQLNGSVNGGNTNITWYPDLFINDIHVLQPIVSPPTNTSYILSVTSTNGCGSSSDTANVSVYKKVMIPNAFSPNGDGINDNWNIKGLTSYDNYKLLVFNRYGQLVFESKNYSQPWNGTFNEKPLPAATYYYVLDLGVGLPVTSGYVAILR